MLWALRAMVFMGYFALAVLVVLGVADLVAKKWQRAVGELLASAAGFAAGMVLLGAAGSLFAGAYENPEDQFRLLTHVASTMMNWSVTGFAIGGIAGTLLAMRRRKLEEAS
jgi:hypothetical protein